MTEPTVFTVSTLMFQLSPVQMSLMKYRQGGCMEHLSGDDILIRALKDVGVTHLWGYPGGAALHIYDAI